MLLIPSDDYWRKEFLGDNTAMLLHDVSREVKSIKEFLEDDGQLALDPLANLAGMQTRSEASPLKRPLTLPKLATVSEVSKNVLRLIPGAQNMPIWFHPHL